VVNRLTARRRTRWSTPRRSAQRIAALCVVFAANGLLFASWVSRIPAVRDRLDASEGELGLAILGVTVGAIGAMPSTNRLSDRFGKRVLPAAVGLAGAGMVAAVGAPTLPWLAAGLVVAGLGMGVWDVAMNVVAHEIERDSGKPLMPFFHAAFSGGAIVGAGLGALAAHADVPVAAHVAGVAVGLVAFVVVATTRLPDPAVEHAVPGADAAGRRGARAGLPLLAIAAITFCAAFGEGAAADWSALFLTDERGTSASVAALGYAAFAAAMAGGRLAGPWILARLGRARALRTCGGLVVVGVVALVAVPVDAVALAALLTWGLGASLVFPATISAAGELPGPPARSIARVSAVGYSGFLAGPPLIGALAEHVGLGPALSVVVVLGVAVVALAGAARERVGGGAQVVEPAMSSATAAWASGTAHQVHGA
jgi:MFS family permease